MLINHRIHATLPATDLQRALAFYEEKLGLTPSEETPGGVMYECAGGSRFALYPTSGVASGAHTQAGWSVADVEAEVAALRAKGVEFIEYDAPGLKTVNGVATFEATKAAWFTDSEGNLLGLVQFL